MSAENSTPIAIVANVSRIVTQVVDRISGDRSRYPLLVAAACQRALELYGVESRIFFGEAAWVQVMSDQTPAWAGCWNGAISFWLQTEFSETVDLNVSVANRRLASSGVDHGPPILWSKKVPTFYRYRPEGVAELELVGDQDREWYEKVESELLEKCKPSDLKDNEAVVESDFANEPILCPNGQVLDDSNQTFRHFDRAISVNGIPEAPF